VLKLIGDGVLAIFRADDAAQGVTACRRCAREASLRSGIKAVNERRPAGNHPVTSVYPWAAHRRSVYATSERGSSGLPRCRPRRQRSESHCRDVAVGGPERRPVVRIRRATPEPERSKLVPWAATPCAASAVRELFTLDPAAAGPTRGTKACPTCCEGGFRSATLMPLITHPRGHHEQHTDNETRDPNPKRTGMVDMKLEVVVIPVSDVDRSKRFYGEPWGGAWTPISRSIWLPSRQFTRPARGARSIRHEDHVGRAWLRRAST